MKLIVTILYFLTCIVNAETGLGAKPVPGSELIFDGSRQMLDSKWTYWEVSPFCVIIAYQMENC